MPLPPFQATLDDHRDAVARFLVASVGRQEADDCLQETMLAALRAYPRLRPGSNIRAWLLTIARNKALDSHRARKRQPVPVGDAVETGGWADGDFDDGPDAGLWAVVRELPPKQRSAVVLRFVNDLSHREIAAVLDCSEAAARRSLHEGLTKLRETWT
jgi:DNA-directed RNA polymerase specialized sigma24 family protein